MLPSMCGLHVHVACAEPGCAFVSQSKACLINHVKEKQCSAAQARCHHILCVALLQAQSSCAPQILPVEP